MEPHAPAGAVSPEAAPTGSDSVARSASVSQVGSTSFGRNPLAYAVRPTGVPRADGSISSLPGAAVAPAADAGEPPGLRRGSSAIGSLRRGSLSEAALKRRQSEASLGTFRKGGPGGGTFARKNSMALGGTQRSVFASMLLGGDDAAAEGGDGGGRDDAPDEVSSYGTADLDEASNQIFMPNLKREKFVPVALARDKLKQVLVEVASLKAQHHAALSTMERKQEFLKAQLEAAVAAYARKLTADYNGRVTALEDEYKRRLDNLNATALGDMKSTLDRAKADAAQQQAKLKGQLEEKSLQAEKEQALVAASLAEERRQREDAVAARMTAVTELKAAQRALDDAQVKARVAEAKVAERDREIAALRRELAALKAAGPADPGAPPPGVDLPDDDQVEIGEDDE